MASDIFAKIGDIKGESVDSKHKDEIEVLAWSWGVSQWLHVDGRRRRRGKGDVPRLSSRTTSTRRRPKLLKACATGEHIKEATITSPQGRQGPAGVS